MRNLRGIVAIGTLLFVATTGAQQQQSSRDQNRWEPNMQKFEEQEKASPSPKGAIVFWGTRPAS